MRKLLAPLSLALILVAPLGCDAIFSDFVLSRALQAEFEAGYKEVEPDMSGFVREWKKTSRADRRRTSASAIMWYGTTEEVTAIFTLRAALFLEIAENSSKNSACSGGDIPNSVFEPASRFANYARMLGRAMAHDVRNDTIWSPKVNFDDQKHWTELGEYLQHSGGNNVWNDLMAGVEMAPVAGVPSRSSSRASERRVHMCKAMAELYRMAVVRGGDDVGGVQLFDFVRSLELWSADHFSS